MPVRRVSLVIPLLFALTACSLLQHEKDTNVIVAAKQLLDAQKDQYGDPLAVDLPVQVNYSVDSKPEVDRDLKIHFQFIALKPIAVLRIGLVASEGLELVSSNTRERYLNLKSRQQFNKTVLVQPTAENEFYLNLYVVSENGDKKLARLIKVPIAIGDYSLKGTPGAAAADQ